MDDNLYAKQYTQTIEFLLNMLKNDLDDIYILTSNHEEQLDRLPTYLSMLQTIEQMRWWFVWSIRPKQELLDQDHLYDINNQAINLINKFIIYLNSKIDNEKILSIINNQNQRVSNLLKK